MDKWGIILIVCVVLFLLSFCLLYSKGVSKVFRSIGGGIKAFFGLFKKNRVKLTKEQKKNRVEKSELQTRPVLLLPNATKKEEEKEEEKPKKDAKDTIKLGGKLVGDDKRFVEIKNFDEKKRAMKDDFDKFLDELEEGNEGEDLDDFFDEDEDEESLNEEFKNKVRQTNSVKVDGEEVDLAKLPPKIRRLLLSGILDRKEDE